MNVNAYAAQAQQVNKFLDATRQLGAIMDQDQGTTRVIYDTTGPLTNLTQYDFFESVTSKVFPATNIEQNKFQPGEGMVIKEIGFTSYVTETSVPAPVQVFDFNRRTAMFSVVDVYIGNNRVVKALPLTAFTTIAALNPLNRNPLTDQNASGSPAVIERCYTYIRMRTNLVIPPEVFFKVVIRTPFVAGAGTAPVNLKCSLKGYGKLFNPGANF